MQKPSHLSQKILWLECKPTEQAIYNFFLSFTLLGFIAFTTLSTQRRNARTYIWCQGNNKYYRCEDYQYKGECSFRCLHATNIKIDYVIPFIIAIIFSIKNINCKTKVILLLQLKLRSSWIWLLNKDILPGS